MHGILKCMKATSELRPRRLLEGVPQRMREEPVVILTGPRTVGKSTLLAALAAEFDRPVLDLDRPDAIGHRQAVLLIESFRRFPVQDITTGIMMAALDTRQRFQLSYWDAAIIEASRAMGCTQVLSEDLSDGQDYGGVRVANPFR